MPETSATCFRNASSSSQYTAIGALRVGPDREYNQNITDGSLGVSLITQGLYVIVFTTRYTDLFMPQVPWNFIFKIVYFLTSFYTIAIMQWVYPRSREREISWKLGAIILAGSLVLSPFVMMIFDRSWSVHTVSTSTCVGYYVD